MFSLPGLSRETLTFSLCMHYIVFLLQGIVRNQQDIGLFFEPPFQVLWFWQSAMHGATAALPIFFQHVGQQTQQKRHMLLTLKTNLEWLELSRFLNQASRNGFMTFCP